MMDSENDDNADLNPQEIFISSGYQSSPNHSAVVDGIDAELLQLMGQGIANLSL